MSPTKAQSLRNQVAGLRDQLQRESLAFGELRAQAARYEAIAHDAPMRVDEADARERKLLRDLGATRQRIAELEATVNQPRERLVAAARLSPLRVSGTRNPRASKPLKVYIAETFRAAKVARKKSKAASKRARSLNDDFGDGRADAAN